MPVELKLNFDGYEGHITMRVATNIDRIDIMDKIGVNLMDLVGDKEVVANLFTKASTIVRLLKASKKYYESVNLKGVNRNVLLESFDDLNNDPQTQNIMMECATKALLGLGDSEQKKPVN
jgi:hypothetical protein